jgi:hypothetical protein
LNTGAYTSHDFEAASPPAKRIVNFYNEFREKASETGEPLFRQYELIILGIFLGRGTP